MPRTGSAHGALLGEPRGCGEANTMCLKSPRVRPFHGVIKAYFTPGVEAPSGLCGVPCVVLFYRTASSRKCGAVVRDVWLGCLRSPIEWRGSDSRKSMVKRALAVVMGTFGKLYLGAMTTDLQKSCCI